MRRTRTFALAIALYAGAGGAYAVDGEGAPPPLNLRTGLVDTTKAPAALAAALPSVSKSGRVVIQLDGPITPQRRARLVAAGLLVGDYIPTYAYIVDPTAADAKAVAALEFIRWWSPYQKSWKLHPDLGKRAYLTPQRQTLAVAGRDHLTISVFAGADAEAVKRSLWAIPGTKVLSEDAINGHIELLAEMRPADAPILAASPSVQFIEPAPEVTPRSNLTTRWIVQSNIPNSFPLYTNGLHGEGQIVGILDGRVDVNHCSFLDTVHPIGPTHRKIVGMQTTGGADLHGTHVAGICVGDGGVEDNTRGVAYLAKLSWGTDGDDSASAFTTGITFNRSNGAHVHTNSWGNDGTTDYDALCRAIDDQTWNNEDDAICFAVTNTSTLKNPENAKNVLAVGNDQDTPNQNATCTGGVGPTSDGRRKPEIWAPGDDTLSSEANTTCGVVSLTGTSMASPAIAGTALLVREYYMNGYYPGGVAGSGASLTPSGALLRATLLNTGQDLTGSAAGSPCVALPIPAGYPSPQEGWGRVKADDALYFPGDARKLFVRDVRNTFGLSTGGDTAYTVNVVGSGQPLRITLTWSDAPAAAGVASAAINDLDLVVVGPGGTYLGNVFNTTAGQSITGGVRDSINNTEQVHLLTPTPGAYTVHIHGANIAQGTQGYALVVTGDLTPDAPPPVILSLTSTIPSLLPPGQAFSLGLTVGPGSQNVLPGSPTAWYRTSPSSSFISFPLTSLGGTSYRADFSPPHCGDTPQFYFTASGDQGGVVSLPSTAPTQFFSTSVGSVNTTTFFTESFESGLPNGWSATGLWHVTNSCSPGPACDGTSWAYYGQDATCTYATGTTANSGLLTSPPIHVPSVPSGGVATLTYCSAKQSENSAQYDLSTVLVNGSTVVDTAGEAATFETRTVDLTPYAGQTITLSWRFDTVDGTLNNYRGWQVDNIRLATTFTGCVNPPSCYANCDGSTSTPILNVADFTCFLQKYAAADPYANCDQSTASPVLNVADFTCFLQKFAQGCP